MNAKEIVEKTHSGEELNIDPEKELAPLSRFLWKHTLDSIRMIPDELNIISLNDQNLEFTVNEMIKEINFESKVQLELYMDLIDQLLNFEK